MISLFAAFKNQWTLMFRTERAIMVGILALGVFLRAFRLDVFEFKADELEGITLGLAAPAQHWWIEHGATSSVQIPFGPAFCYIMGLLTNVTHDPYILTGFILAANIVILMLSVLFFAEFSRDRRQFLLCVLLFSLSPYLIIFSRKIWQPNLMLLFIIPLVLMIIKVRRDPRLFLPIGLLSSIVVQLHHSGIFYIPLLICFAVLMRYWRPDREDEVDSAALSHRRTAVPWAVGGFIAFVTLLIPYLTFLFRNFQHTGIRQWLSSASSDSCVLGALKWLLFTPTGSNFWRAMFSGKASDWNWPVAPFPGAILFFSYLLIIPFLMGVFKYAAAAVRFVRDRSPGQTALFELKELLCPLSIGYLFLVYCFVLHRGRPHHYVIILPFLILALSRGILDLTEFWKGRETARRVLLCFALISYVLQYPFVLAYVNARNGSMGEYGVCYREQKNAAKEIAELAARKQTKVIHLASVDESLAPSPKAELRETIAYICRADFGIEVVFNADPEPGAKVLRLVKTGETLHLKLGEWRSGDF
jgi:hypothetical protein